MDDDIQIIEKKKRNIDTSDETDDVDKSVDIFKDTTKDSDGNDGFGVVESKPVSNIVYVGIIREVRVKDETIQSTNSNYKYIIALQRIAMGMPVAARKGSGVGVARGSKRSWNYVEETDTEEEDIGTSDESEIVCFFGNETLYKNKYEIFIYAGGKVCLIFFQ